MNNKNEPENEQMQLDAIISFYNKRGTRLVNCYNISPFANTIIVIQMSNPFYLNTFSIDRRINTVNK